MDLVTDTLLANVSSAVANSLNSKLHSIRKTFQAHHLNSPDTILCYGVVEKVNASVFTLEGIIDAKVAPELHELLDGCQSRKQNIIICLSDVLYLDTAGAATILESYADARNKGLGFMLADISLNARHTINLCRLSHVLPICEHIKEAEKKYMQSLRCT